VRRLGLAALLALAVVLSPLPALAQDEADDPAVDPSGLQVGEIDVSGYPTLEVIVAAPAPGPGEEIVFSVIEPGRLLVPETVLLGSTALDFVLVIDTSGSMRGSALAAAQEAALVFVEQLPGTARIAVVGFGADTTVAVPLTGDRGSIAAGVEGLVASGETALYDAVLVGSELVADSDGRSALVVLTDGGDTVSTATLGQAASAIDRVFDIVSAVGLATTETDAATLEALVGEGRVASAGDASALTELYRAIANEIASRNVLRWETTLDSDRFITIEAAVGDTIERSAVTVDIDEAVVAALATGVADPSGEPSTDESPAGEEEASRPIRTELVTVEPGSSAPGWLLGAGVLTIAGAIFLGVTVVMIPRQRTRSLVSDFRGRLPQGRELGVAARQVVALAESLLGRDPDRRTGLALRLERAGLELAPAEFAAVLGSAAAIGALLGFGLGGLFGLLFLPLLVVVGGLAWLNDKGRKRSAAFISQLDSTLQLISGSLRSGFGLMQALDTVAVETEEPTSEEFTRVLGEVRLGRDLGAAFEASARRVDSEDYHWVVAAIEISREVGGNLAEVLDNVSNTIRQRNTLRRQVQALSAEGRVSALILFLLPIVMFAWMRFSNPEYIELLFDRSSGRFALGAAAVLLMVGAAWMRKIIEVRF